MPRLSPPRSKRVQITEEPHPGEATLPEEEVVVELSDDDLDGLTIETAPQEPEPSPEPEPQEADPDEAVRKAVEAQQRAEEIARNAQRERDDALRQAREQQEQLSRERGDRQDAEYNSVLTAIAAEQATLDRAQAEYAAALQAGDYDVVAKANATISRAAARIDRLEDNKAAFDQQRAATKDQPPRQPEPPRATQTVEQQIEAYNVPDNAKAWLRQHPEMITDPAQTQRLSAAHQYITTIKGLSQFTPAYFEALEADLGIRKSPAPVSQQPLPQPQRRSMPVTAPVSRDVPTSSGQRQTSSQVTLSPEEVRIARTSFTDPTGKMTNAEKERLYALNKLKLQRMRANGEYPSRERA